MEEKDAARRRELQREFSANLRGDVRFDPFSRALYSTDASNHRIEPLGVVVPRSGDEVSAAVSTAAELDVPVLARGGGTSLAGQSIGHAVILDCSKHLDRIHRIDPDSRVAEVGPGVSCDQLNTAAAMYGLKYGPDPASADRATFGGMIGNNATGAHSIQYGMTADHVLDLDVTLADGSEANLGPQTPEGFRAKGSTRSLEGQIYRTVSRLRDGASSAIEANWPRTWRRASGYSLNYLTGYTPGRPPAWALKGQPYPPHDGYNLAPLLCGSEGTLAVIRKATVRLVPRPAAQVLVVLTFDSVAEAAARTPYLLEQRPSAVELLPRALLERARGVPAYARKLTFVDDIPAALLVVEFSADSVEEARALAQPLVGEGRTLESSEAQSDLWEVRKAGLGLLMSVPGDVKPITFIEDVAVPVEELADYVRRAEEILDDHGTTAEWYAHASAGCLHLRPMINLKTVQGVRQMRGIAEAVAEEVLALRGSLSGEHGDGISHTEFTERLYGPELMQSFIELKRAFDPQGILNPGKVVPSERAEPPRLDRQLRYGGEYKTIPVTTEFAHRREGSLAGAVEACTGLGVCRKSDGVMCPSYQATRDENDLTRGRANALRAALSGALPASALTSEGMRRIFDLCLECKGCKAECPTAVDIARVKAEFLALYQEEHGLPLRSRLFGEIHQLSSWLKPVAPLVNWMGGTAPMRWAQEQLLGVARQRQLPPFQRRAFLDDWHFNAPSTVEKNLVVLFVDTYTNYHHPELGWAACQVLGAAGWKVLVERQQVCCGRPMISKGMLARARHMAEHNLAALADHARQGIPIVGLEPSCLLTLRDEYLEFFPDDERAQVVAGQSYLLEEFLTAEWDGERPLDSLHFSAEEAGAVWIHTHCHAKAATGGGPTLEMLGAAGYRVTEIDSGCCGMAGSFGFEAEHYDVSMQVGELSVLPAARRAEEEGAQIGAHGTSCRTQIHDGAGGRAVHPVLLLKDRLVTGDRAGA